jgi:glutathione S-transferase
VTIKLYELAGRDSGRPFSPHCWKIRMALAHKQLDFEPVPVGFTSIPQLEGGITKIVPLIRDGEKLVADSFDIAQYLEQVYPDRPSLFMGEGGLAMARLIERWSQQTIHPQIGASMQMDILNLLGENDARYYRENRETRFGRKLEDVSAGREVRLADFRKSLEPLRDMLSYQPFIGGAVPLFSDYIVFGAFQFARVVTPFQFLEDDDVITDWFERCLQLHNRAGLAVAAAA